jgi:2-isopropylmalate synthase
VLKHRETYEIMSAESVGWRANRLTLGKLSGRNAFKTRLQEIGIELGSEEALNAAFKRFKDLADKKREIFDEDLQALITEEEIEHVENERYHLVSLTAHSETGEPPYAKIVLSEGGRERPCEAQGSGPVDASFKAIESVVKSGAELLLYSVNNITSGTDAQGEVTVRLSKGGRIVNGQGADTDIVVASAKAYVNALNKLQSKLDRINPQV